ncbi:hypothetical protein K435DRAFT_480035 [Dendrothele bispora CBS 962.96]|uniref:Uncharacterized protein n=1 Tax=Dendrothele bispora (strain CBS 962.96) TaxID=1314807 RepID=A0A4S8MTE5_DENBC|nr:hypothetical protein K435DRAFT_480035 [Dendrothele bispora CBS 962.96]
MVLGHLVFRFASFLPSSSFSRHHSCHYSFQLSINLASPSRTITILPLFFFLPFHSSFTTQLSPKYLLSLSLSLA